MSRSTIFESFREMLDKDKINLIEKMIEKFQE